jgi:photosystem II stability/assembly factor-like uncharacterized protein
METARTFQRFVPAWGLALLAGAALLSLDARAQGLPAPGDGFTWQRVGDRSIQPFDLAFGPGSTLWATANDGPHRLDLSAGLPGTWVLVSDFAFNNAILPLGRGPQGDTLVVTTNGTVRRSTDGGQTWPTVFEEQGGEALYEVPAGYPFAGRILAGATGAVAYSDDRAASFTASVVPAPGGNRGGADDFVALPPGSQHPGRILAAGRWGVNISDDGGATFRESALWRVLYYVGEAIGAVDAAGGIGSAGDAGSGATGVLGGRVSGQADARAWTSADGGQTWGPGDGQPLLEGPPHVTSGSVVAVLALGGSSVLAVLKGGTVYRSDDAGATWAAVGRAPEVGMAIYTRCAALGPDGRLYVGLIETGAFGEGWVYRTQEVVTVAVGTEPGSEPGEQLGLEVAPNPFRDEAAVTLTLARPGEVSASVYDVLGRRVALLHEGLLPAGTHDLTLDGSALTAGVYVIRAAAWSVGGTGRDVVARRVTVLR